MVHERQCPIGKKIRELEAKREEGVRETIAKAAIGPAVEEVKPEMAAEPAVEIKVAAEVVERFLLKSSEVLAAHAGERWRLEKIEAASLAVSWSDVVNIYWPTIESKKKVLYLALFNTGMILAPRVADSLVEGIESLINAIRKRRAGNSGDRGDLRNGKNYAAEAVSQAVE